MGSGAVGCIAGLLAWMLAGPAEAASPPVFQERVVDSTNGSAQLKWDPPAGAELYEIEHVAGPGIDAGVVYRDRLPAAHVSGLPEGDHTYRVRARSEDRWSAWSEPVIVRVTFPLRWVVWLAFGIGFALTALTGAYVARGGRVA